MGGDLQGKGVDARELSRRAMVNPHGVAITDFEDHHKCRIDTRKHFFHESCTR